MNSNSDKLFYIEELVKKIITTKDQALYQIIDEGNGGKQISTSYLAEAIRLTIKNDVYSILEQFPLHDFNPYVNVFIQNVIHSGIYNAITRYDSVNHRSEYFCDDYIYELFLTMVTNLQAFVDQIRRDVQADSFKKTWVSP